MEHNAHPDYKYDIQDATRIWKGTAECCRIWGVSG